MPVARVYADTSVFGGVFDDEYARASEAFFDRVRRGEFVLVVSALVEDELEPAPTEVRSVFQSLLPLMERVDVSRESLNLRQAYIRAGILTRKSAADALHVAIATTSRCSVLVSWNCRHIVHFQKIPKFNAVNRLEGWAEIAIHTPMEVADDRP